MPKPTRRGAVAKSVRREEPAARRGTTTPVSLTKVGGHQAVSASRYIRRVRRGFVTLVREGLCIPPPRSANLGRLWASAL